MPFRRPHAEALREAVEELRRERDLRHQDQRLPAAPHGLGDRLEIDLVLPEPVTPSMQRDRIAARRDGRPQRIGSLALRRREIRAS